MPSLAHLAEDPIVKAAILSKACHFTIGWKDLLTPEYDNFVDAVSVFWAIEELQKRYPRYLQYARWVAIKEGVELTEKKTNRKGARYRNNKDTESVMETVPPPGMGRGMQEEWQKRVSPRDVRVAGTRRAPVDRADTVAPLADFLKKLRAAIESQVQSGDPAQDTPVETVPVDVDGKGTIIDMTPEMRDLWNSLAKRKPGSEQSSTG